MYQPGPPLPEATPNTSSAAISVRQAKAQPSLSPVKMEGNAAGIDGDWVELGEVGLAPLLGRRRELAREADLRPPTANPKIATPLPTSLRLLALGRCCLEAKAR